MTIKRRIQRLERVTPEPTHTYRDPCSGTRKLRAFLRLPPPPEASGLAGLVEAYRKALETTELEARLKALEEKRA
tara:strand:- start:149 stop:373 length:225 start_codon:yes stop_codon:yes gene_type:complete